MDKTGKFHRGQTKIFRKNCTLSIRMSVSQVLQGKSDSNSALLFSSTPYLEIDWQIVIKTNEKLKKKTIYTIMFSLTVKIIMWLFYEQRKIIIMRFDNFCCQIVFFL